MARAICPAPYYWLPQPRFEISPESPKNNCICRQDREDDRLPLACKALSCVQTRDTKSKLGKAENRCLSVLTDDRGGLKRTTQRDDLGMPPLRRNMTITEQPCTGNNGTALKR